MDKLSVLVADKSSVYNKMFTKAVTGPHKNALITCAADSYEALELAKVNSYDIIVVDTKIPGLGLTELIKRLRRDIPTAFILVTAGPSPVNDRIFAEALLSGASECMTKPIYDSYNENLLIIKSKINAIVDALHDDGEKVVSKTWTSKTRKKGEKKGFYPETLLIASSTGGPTALEAIIPKLRGDFPVPILIVQHMPLHFTETLAQNLDMKSKLNVKVAENRESIIPGTVYIAPGGLHMKVDSKSRIRLDESPLIHGVRPAADALFKSVTESYSKSDFLVVVLTGMGIDGKEGILKLKDKLSCFCIAQSERTCVVYGMPRAVIEAGLADKVLDLDKISFAVEDFFIPGAL